MLGEQSSHPGSSLDPLLAGFFTIRESAQLLRVSQRTVRGWLNGYSNTTVGPIVERDFTGTSTVSFLDLMEMRFIQLFRAAKVPMPTLRKAVEIARTRWDVRHPLAISNERYITDRRQIFAQIAKDDEDRATWNLVSGQHEMWDMLQDSISKDVVFDPEHYRPTRWKPKPEFDNVIVDPRINFGRPVIAVENVPTSAIVRQWEAERSCIRVAEWYGVSQDAVKTAIEFEWALAA